MNDILQRLGQTVPYLSADAVQQLIASAVIIVLLFMAYWWFVRALAAMRSDDKLSEHTFTILRRVCYWSVVLVALFLVLQQFGLMENAWATLTAVLAMVAIGFVAVWSVLSNTLCSIILMIVRPFNVGDTIEIPADALRGKVVDFSLIFTTLRDEDGSLLQVPNNTFFQKPIRREVGKKTVSLVEQADEDKPHE